MIKDTNNLADIFKLKIQKDNFDSSIDQIVKIINEVTTLIVDRKSISIKNNVIKIKEGSNKRFFTLLYLDALSQKIKTVNNNFSIEL